ncbi:MAG: hypothetical protein UT32_C0002G0056 [Parcubacteria group bacterium GW2011_GWC2_39_14]|nr:MAG: hypothetical protein UT32_C0002G0056 [Parcubacteria group bacterium GW2011_GWC2_39_14]KKR55281.1 MAG: hypothetical protein UT91_C0003G0056 [Parcubacteria group bacterium GW2011_GWA2_40_23]
MNTLRPKAPASSSTRGAKKKKKRSTSTKCSAPSFASSQRQTKCQCSSCSNRSSDRPDRLPHRSRSLILIKKLYEPSVWTVGNKNFCSLQRKCVVTYNFLCAFYSTEKVAEEVVYLLSNGSVISAYKLYRPAAKVGITISNPLFSGNIIAPKKFTVPES